MTRTVSDLVTRALQRLFVVEGGESAEAADSALVLSAFNALVDGWFADGLTVVADETATVPVALVEGTSYALDDNFPLLARHFEGVAAMLAVSCAPDFQADLTPSLVKDATDGRQRLDAAFMPSMVSTVDRALRRLPSSVLWPGSN